MSTETQSTETRAEPTVCPGCGAKIPRRGLSMCPYCITPLPGAKADGETSQVAERLKRMEEKEGFAEALERTPEEGAEWQRGATDRVVGKFMAVLGVALLGLYALVAGPDYGLVSFTLWTGVTLIGFGLMRLGRGKQRMDRATAKPMLKRAAILHERRSETEIQGGEGDTVYFYDVEFADGVRGEFRYPGRGAAEEPWPNGATGVAYTRGDELIDFQRVRV